MEKRQGSEIQRLVWVFQLLLAGVIVSALEGLPCIVLDRFQIAASILIHTHIATLSLRTQKYLHIVDSKLKIFIL